MKNPLTILIALFTFNCAFANPPTTIKVKLDWQEEKAVIPYEGAEPVYITRFTDAVFHEAHPSLPYYSHRFPMGSYGEVKAVITNPVFESFEKTPSPDDQVLTGQIDVQVEVEKDRLDYFARVAFIPVIQAGTGRYERLVSFELKLSFNPLPPTVATRGGHTYQSVLSDGDIYKFAVNETGVHKLDFDFLKNQLGIPLENIDPRTIKLYGNGGGVVPELVDTPRPDDLIENAIRIVGEEDGTFDSGDYILFYGQGADVWKYNESKQAFDFPKNFYDTRNYYFLKTSAGNGLRISSRASQAGETYTTNTFSDFKRYEKEQYNLQHDWSFGQGSGRQYFSDYFRVKDEEDYSDEFEIDNLVANAPVKLEVVFAARIKSGSFGRYTITANGNTYNSGNFGTTKGESVDTYAYQQTVGGEFIPNSDQLSIALDFDKGNDVFNEGWLDYIQANFRRELIMAGNQMIFRDLESVGKPVSRFVIRNASPDLEVWDITNPLQPMMQNAGLSGTELSFGTNTETLKEFIAFNRNNGLLSAEAISNEKIPNQNIHGIDDVDMAIVYHKDFAEEAERLAEHRRDFSELDVAVVDVDQLFNEFSSGRKDAGAIRDFAVMLFERNPEKFNSLLLFGDGSFDSRDIYKLGGNFIPVWETINSLSPIYSFPSDDFYGLLSEGEGADVNKGSLDIGVGRLPVKSPEEARAAVDKIIHYDVNPENFRDWRNRVAFVGDDEDNNLHTSDADGIAEFIGNKNSNLNIDKIYLDAFPQESTPGGTRIPLATEALNNNIFKGVLAMIYLGHGGTKGWTQERVLKIEDILSWTNFDKMPLIITATCSFSGFDNPAFTTAGELCFLNKKGGAIALYTTVRPVFANSNEALTRASVDTLFYKFDNERPTLGEVLRISKNKVGDASNSRKFLLLGDPAQKLALPNYNVVTTKINGHDISSSVIDTIRALQKVTIEGEVHDDFGNRMSAFQGVVYPTIYDKEVVYRTLAQDPRSFPFDFTLQKNIIFKGRARVTDGRFSFTFVVPKDINYNFGSCKISYYASDETGLDDAAGNYQEVIVGGTDPNALTDDTGPKVEVFMDDESFVFGGVTSSDPLLLVKLEDDNGINVVGNAIGHDLTGVMDGNSQSNSYTLNDFYEAALDDHTRGEVRYPLSSIPEGRHEIKVTAWDIANNPAEGFTEFVVVSSEETALEHVLNYPNPFTSSTCFMFELDPARPGVELDVLVQIYTVSGRLIKTLEERIIFEGRRLGNDKCIRWDGRDDYGDPLAKGVYLYKVRIQSPNTGETLLEGESEFEKLVILK